ncbi:hypothetical protein HHI36_010869 [Cryptolaemus montrouzieri]|uniref:Sulfatase N-terminal domain-containing protein n=2 Tax=Cryptolaemus montrouzieri TaxID=559131 RepID=A0ABD2MK10_9CUCU
MKMFILCFSVVLLINNVLSFVLSEGKPHIIFIIADDLGWNDVSFHGGNQIPTPNLDALAYNGVILNSHYVQSMGTPSRAALFTGKYPTKLGMQGPSITVAESRTLPEGKILPQYLKEMGYSTYLVGKWDLGYSRWNATPTQRGFDHHFGYFNEYTSYYDYLSTWKFNNKEYTGFDLRYDKTPSWENVGKYATDLFTEYGVNVIQNHDVSTPLFLMMSHLAVHSGNEGKPLEAPQETINKFKHIVDANRRTYAAMVSKLDDAVGTLVEALASRDMLQNSIVVFISDNGAPTQGHFRNWGSNYPLRGIKDTLFEGGIRSVACIWSPLLVQSARVSRDLMHITDWLPTLFTAAGGDSGLLDLDIDGIDQWASLVYELPSARNDILLNIDEKTRNAALRLSNWKLIVGSSNNGSFNGFLGQPVLENIQEPEYDATAVYNSPAGRSIKKVSYNTPLEIDDYVRIRIRATVKCVANGEKNPCDPSTNPVCLYDIPSDPCEENDLAKFFPSVVRRLKRSLVEYRKDLLPQIEQESNIERADPKLFKYTWNPWLDCSDLQCTS